jgi:hypothetical protein
VLAEAVQQAQDTADTAEESAAAANAALPGKADKIIIPQTRTLAQADAGDVLGVVTFDTAQTPASLWQRGALCLQAAADLTFWPMVILPIPWAGL